MNKQTFNSPYVTSPGGGNGSESSILAANANLLPLNETKDFKSNLELTPLRAFGSLHSQFFWYLGAIHAL